MVTHVESLLCITYSHVVVFEEFSHNKCDVMGQNQSHVAKRKMAEICIFSENVKICPFLVFIKNKILV